eukprot:1176123-Prorocentrum_minimum.AAC.2
MAPYFPFASMPACAQRVRASVLIKRKVGLDTDMRYPQTFGGRGSRGGLEGGSTRTCGIRKHSGGIKFSFSRGVTRVGVA